MSEKRKFREDAPVRSTDVPHYKNYQMYKRYLQKDFHGRCVYCNVPEVGITDKDFAVDHFIPQAVYKDIDPSMETNYENLMLACPICNRAKGKQYKGDFPADKKHNLLFYHPFEKDYNEVFYRDEKGVIQSDDPLGKAMILRLDLHHPCHALEYIVELTEKSIDTVTDILSRPGAEMDARYKEAMEKIKNELCAMHAEDVRLLRKTYKQKLAADDQTGS